MFLESLITTVTTVIKVTIIAVGAYVGAQVGGPTGAVIGAGVPAVTIEVLEPLNTEETTTEILEVVPEADRANVLKNQQMWETIESLGYWSLLVFVLFWLIPDPFTIIRRLLMK